MSYLGIDLGTSGLRALLVGEDGAPIGSVERHLTVSRLQPGWSEQNPSDWVQALESAVEELRAEFPAFAGVEGIGVAGHMHGATLLDSAGEVIRPCILWDDTRSHEEAAYLDALPEFREISGNIVFTGFTAPKLEWLRKNEPEAHARVAKVLLPVAYLTFYLTGDHVADRSDSAGTSWLNVRTREWSDSLLQASHMRADQMPRLVEGCAPAGRLKPDLVTRWGLSGKVVIAGGAGDNAAAACGIGALNEGQGFVSLGTSGVLLVARDGYRAAPDTAVHTFCHAVPDRWYQMGVMLSATNSLNWLSKISGKTPAQLTGSLGDDLRPPGRVQFFPYLSGERTPHNDAAIRAGFVGLGSDTTLDDLTRAVLEGVAFGLRDSAEALKASGAVFDTLYAIGGGSASSYWVQLLATVLGVPMRIPSGGEFGAAMGAARLAKVASTGEDPDQVMSAPGKYETVPPLQAYKEKFDEAYRLFRAAYPNLRKAQLGPDVQTTSKER